MATLPYKPIHLLHRVTCKANCSYLLYWRTLRYYLAYKSSIARFALYFPSLVCTIKCTIEINRHCAEQTTSICVYLTAAPHSPGTVLVRSIYITVTPVLAEHVRRIKKQCCLLPQCYILTHFKFHAVSPICLGMQNSPKCLHSCSPRP